MPDEPDFNTLPPEAELPPANLPKSTLIMGIDLGTTYSCVAVVQEDYPKVIPSRLGLRTMPSIIAIDEKGRLLVGEEARKQLLINPTNTIYGAKRFIGRHFYSEEVTALSKYFSYEVVPLDNMEIGAKAGDRIFTLPQVSALILNELRRNVCEYFQQNVYLAVVSVPAYYSENQREAVREASRIAGIEVVRIINEPTAAALAYGLNKNLEKRILVYDLGGGTFDASILELYENVFRVLSTGGDSFLGGVDFDERIVDFILGEYERTQSEILQCDSVINQRLKDAAEKAKIELSSKTTAQIELPYITISKGKFKDFKTELTRTQLNRLTDDLVSRTIEVCLEVLDSAKLFPENIDSILLVGGQTRAPLVVEKISRFFGRAPSKGVHPDEVVACGAALMAHSLGTQSSVRLIDVLPMSIGGRQPDGAMKVLLNANTPLPAEYEFGMATTHANQQVIEIALYQGESTRAVENEFLGAFVISGFPKAPTGQVKLAIKLSLNQESLMEVSGRLLGTNQPIQVKMQARTPTGAEDIVLTPLAPSGDQTSPFTPTAEQQDTRRRLFSGLRGFIRRISS
jgi:Molecular chaperone